MSEYSVSWNCRLLQHRCLSYDLTTELVFHFSVEELEMLCSFCYLLLLETGQFLLSDVFQRNVVARGAGQLFTNRN